MRVKKFKLTPALKRKLDRLFSAYIHARDNNTCQMCGKTDCKLDTAHIIPRQCLNLRWNELNAILLCPYEHKWAAHSFHQNPLVFSQWYSKKYGETQIYHLLQLSDIPFDSSEANINKIIESLKII